MNKNQKILFLDESGDHNLSIIDPSYPLFVLGGVIVNKNYAEQELTDLLDDFKLRLFGKRKLSCTQLTSREIRMVLKD